MAKVGKLSVKLSSDSVFFEDKVAVEVRDSKMRLVQGPSHNRQFDLPVGLYEVSAVLEDGRKHSQLVQVREGEPAPVELCARKESQIPQSPRQAELMDAPVYEPPRYTQKIASLLDARTEADTGLDTQLLAWNGASLIREMGTLWIFECERRLESVPTALLQVGNQKTLISLPISPEGGFPANSCAVRIEKMRTGAHVNAWISPERTVANALQNMLASGYVLHAASVADDAVGLLRDKYSDPPGATLGALILHKVGWLERWTDWVENLARDFDWLPDGKVMLATLLYNKESRKDEALDIAIKASTQRMLYTESYSLLLDLLRRWPRDWDSDHEARSHAIHTLALHAPYIDWESICLSQTIEEEV